MKVIIVGGVAGGATAAARLRRLDENAEIIIIERDEYVSYANCGLPYYVGGVIKEKNNLLVQSVKGLSARYKLDIRIKSEVVNVDKEAKTVTVRRKDDGTEYVESYDKLLLSCGAKPVTPPIDGLKDAANVFTVRNVSDALRIKDFVIKNKVKNAVVVGGGFIGVEMAENLTEAGVNVTLIEKMPQILRNFDLETVNALHRELSVHGVNLVLGDGIKAFENNGKTVISEQGKRFPADIGILAIGVTPENTLARLCGLRTGKRGHVLTDDNFRTFDENGKTVEDIFAIGDMIEVTNALDGTSYAVPLAWGANRQGRLVADVLAGRTINQSTIMGTSVLKVFNLTAASTGANETTLKEKNIPYIAIHAHRANHASYYPGAVNIAMKLLYSPDDGKILGFQAVGGEGTEKRVDVVATVMRLKGSVYDLSNLELSYAPPYGSAKDPVNILGYMAENINDGFFKPVHHDEIDEIVKEGGFLLDVRTPSEFANGHVEGAINIPVDELRSRLEELPSDKSAPLYVTCQVGLRAYVGIMILRAAGYDNLYNLSGGYLTYKTYKYRPSANTTTPERETSEKIDLDVTGLICPNNLNAVIKAVSKLKKGDRLMLKAADPGFDEIAVWCTRNGLGLEVKRYDKNGYLAEITIK